jgi:hypothetical protein
MLLNEIDYELSRPFNYNNQQFKNVEINSKGYLLFGDDDETKDTNSDFYSNFFIKLYLFF